MKEETKLKQFNLVLPAEVLKEFKLLAHANDTTMRAIVTECVYAYINTHKEEK